MTEATRWLAQSRMTDPGAFARVLDDLPHDLAGLAAAIQGLLIHESCLAAYGVPEPAAGSVSRATLPLAERLQQIVDRDRRPLSEARPPETRIVVTCRDGALMLCGILRRRGVESRLRCGFANYLGPGWRDHWLCEVRDRTGDPWRLCDAQMDDVLMRALGLGFDPLDVPRAAFLTAGEAWTAWRSGRADAACFGSGATAGPWFMKVDVVRDHLALNGREMSDWDRWREAPIPKRIVADDETAWLDAIATDPEQQDVGRAPDWLGPAGA